MTRESSKPVNLGRHKRNCTICAHAQCDEIERDFINWKSPNAITAEYGIGDRTTVYRHAHAHAIDLFIKRGRNVRAALEKIIERVGEVDVTAAAVVAAIQATTGERTAASLRLENYLGAFRGDAVVVSDGTAPTHDDPIAQSIDAVVVNDKGERAIDPRPDRAQCQNDKEYTDKMAQCFIRQSADKRATPTIVAVPPKQK